MNSLSAGIITNLLENGKPYQIIRFQTCLRCHWAMGLISIGYRISEESVSWLPHN
jgi:hypothetical protein